MSKIGRRPIAINDVKVEVKGHEVHYTGKHASGQHVLPDVLTATVENGQLVIGAKENSRDVRQAWGLHRALLSNKITGAHKQFEKQVRIVGLGYKAQARGDILEFSLGYSHKVDFALPKEVAVDIDKSGQLLTLKSSDREAVGKVCGELRKLKPVEPYKGTGVMVTTDVIIRKAGKAKSA